jgi:chemotaxis protein MotB
MASSYDDDEVPGKTRRGRLIFRLVLFMLLGFAGAAAAGYLWWTQRGDHAAALEELKAKRAAADSCKTALGKVTTERDALKGAVAEKQKVEATLTSMEANLQATRGELDDLRKQRAETEKRLAAFKDLTDKLQKMIDTGKLTVKTRNGVMVVALPAEVLFPSGSAELSEAGQLSVLEVGIILKGFTGRRFMVVGHTDDLPIKSTIYKDNWELSTGRATTVTKFLVKAGMDPKAVIAAGHGEFDPIASNKSKDGREKNRRIEIVLMPDIAELPPIPADEKPAEKPADKPAAPAPTTP